MKLQKIISIGLLALLFTSCEKTMIEKKSSFTDQENLINDINYEIDLSRSQELIVREKLLESKEFHAHPGSLWKLAASLYDILSDEQITDLLSTTKEGTFYDHAFNSEPEHGPKHKKVFDFKIKFLSKIINESQSESFNLLIQKFNIHKDSLIVKWMNNEISVDEFKSNIFSLNNYFKVSVEQIMTEEQVEKVDSKTYDIKTSKRDFGIHSKDPQRFKEEKQSALEITDEQLIQLENLIMKFEINLEILNLDFREGNSDDNLFIQNVADLMQSKQSDIFNELTEKQNTIIKIHHALTIKAHKKYSYSGKG